MVPLQKACPFQFLYFLLFFKNSIFIFTFKKRSLFVGKYIYRPLSNRGSIKNISKFYHIFHFINLFLKLSSKSHNFNIWQKNIMHSIMANIIGQVQKLGKQNRNLPGMTTNLLTVPVSKYLSKYIQHIFLNLIILNFQHNFANHQPWSMELVAYTNLVNTTGSNM